MANLYVKSEAINHIRLKLHDIKEGYILSKQDALAISTVLGYADRMYNRKNGPTISDEAI